MDSSAIDIRPLATQGELRACVALQRETWGDTFSDVVPASILKVSQRLGGIAIGAFDGERLLGFVFGLTGIENGRVVHWSDMLAVRADARNLGLGRRLKEAQRAMARQNGASLIYWTYDPLVARNAHLNFNRLGVRLAEYVDDMYGTTDSALHGGIPTDRLIVAWSTDDDELDRRLAEAERALSSPDCHLSPVVTREWVASVQGAAILPHCVRVEIPENAEALLCDDVDRARVWRESVRFGMRWAIAAGYSPSAVDIDRTMQVVHYLMTKSSRPAVVRA